LGSGYADLDGNGKITINELKTYVIKKVDEITFGAQKPEVRKDLLDNDWTLW